MKKHQIKSQTHKISSELLNLLISDSFSIPEEYFSSRLKIENELVEQPEINSISPKITQKLDEELRYLQSAFNNAKEAFDAIFLKIDSTAPIDMSNWLNELKCTHFEDILLTLKYSQLLNTYIMKSNTEYFNLIFRKWYSLNPALEFRCFIWAGNLTAICQRKINCFYHFMPDFGISTVIPKISEFCEKMEFLKDNFILDVYLNSPPNYKVTIVDLQSFEPEKLLLFENFDFDNFKGNVQFKCIISEAEVSLQVFGQNYPLVF